MRKAILTSSIVFALCLLSLTQPCSAGNYTTSITQAGGQNWSGTIWLLDGAGTAVAPSAGNTYECVSNSVAFGNTTSNTRIRNPVATGLQTFPGDSLKLGGNTEIRMKSAGAILNFPGVGSNPGLILDGGILNAGDEAVFVVTGKVQVASQSYIAPGNNGGGELRPLRAVTVDALLSGTGTMVIFQAATNLAQKFTNPSNTFSGEWIVKAGLLQGTAENSLGTNSITIDPGYVLPLDASILDIPGPAVFEPTYDLNSGGALTLINGGLMRLHQNCAFTSVTIEGVSLTSGTHLYSELLASYPNSFEPGGTGAIVVQPYGTLPVFAPAIGAQPSSQSLYPGQTAQLTVGASGTAPLSYQWRVGTNGVYTDVKDDSRITGAKTAALTIQNVAAGDGADYIVVIQNSLGSITSSVATLTVMPISPAENITMSDQEPSGSDWNTGSYWSDGLAASDSAAAKPGSNYELLAGARLRSPASTTVATFPGDLLTVDGDGIWINNPAAGSTMAEIWFKQPNGGTVIFKKLVMNGGQLDSGNPGVVVLGGEIEIRTNTPIYNDVGNDRGYRIVAKLTGTGTIEYHAYNQGSFQTAYVNNLEIAGTNNTFSGKWNVVLGTLLGTATAALGTNDIMVSTDGAFETTYDIDNPDGSLVLDGRMYLHQNDRFRSVTVAGTALTDGTYSFAQLNAAYPSNFPATWTPQTGATNYTAGSGSIIVGNAPAGVTLQYELTGSSLKLTWPTGILLEANEAVGPWQTNSASSPVTVSTAVGKKYYRVQVQ